MMEYTPGQLVYSKSGHDKGTALFIVSVEGDYVYVVDGRLRPLAKPKKKKKKHVQRTNYKNNAVSEKLLSGGYLLDAEIRKALKEYKKQKA